MMALTKNKQKWIRSLAQKKYRDAENCFVAEGHKAVGELATTFRLALLVVTDTYLDTAVVEKAEEVVLVSQQELERVSFLKSPSSCLAVFRKPITTGEEDGQQGVTDLVLALDGIQDPGNLGTIVRLADWFGIKDIYCSQDCADVFSPKTVQATMGALARVECHVVNLPEWLASLSSDTPVLGTFLDGDNFYEKQFSKAAVLVMGNEGKGISKEVERRVTERLYIPPYPDGNNTVESLNVGVATAIVCAELRRQGRVKS